MNTRKKSATSLFILVLLVFAIPQTSLATVEVWQSYGEKYGNVFINANSNHGYFSPSKDYLYKNEIPILSLVASTLWEEKKLSQRTFIFNIREVFLSPSPHENFVSISNECFRLEGEERGESVSYDSCYIADITNADITHENLLVIILAAQKIQDDVKKVDLNNLQTYKQEFQNEIKRFSGKTSVVYPKWSPNGKYLLETIWKDGAVSYEVVDVGTNKTTDLPNLGALPLTNPQWSYNSQYIAYASTDKIFIYDIKNNTTETIELSLYLDKDIKINELSLSFNPKDNILFFAFDINYFADYKSYLWDAKNKTAEFYRDGNIIPWLDTNNLNVSQLGIQRYYEIMNVVPNPTMDKMAVVEKTQDGLTAVKIMDKKNEVSNNTNSIGANDANQSSTSNLNKSILAVAAIELLAIIGLVWRLAAKKKEQPAI